jgi:hypothetical protein
MRGSRWTDLQAARREHARGPGTCTKPPSSAGIECLVLTAIDFRSGRTVFRRRAGTGVGFNDNYAPVTLGPDGSAYVGVISGLVRFSDTGPPPGG